MATLKSVERFFQSKHPHKYGPYLPIEEWEAAVEFALEKGLDSKCSYIRALFHPSDPADVMLTELAGTYAGAVSEVRQAARACELAFEADKDGGQDELPNAIKKLHFCLMGALNAFQKRQTAVDKVDAKLAGIMEKLCNARTESDKAENKKPATKLVKLPSKGARSMKRSEVDPLINAIISSKAKKISDLEEAIKRDDCGAQAALKAAKKSFGCVAIQREIRCRSHSWVSTSPVWRNLASRLRLYRRPSSPKRKTGLEIGVEKASDTAVNDEGIEAIDRADTIKFIRNQLPTKEAEALIKKLNDGEISDEKATKIAKLGNGQQIDDHSRKAL